MSNTKDPKSHDHTMPVSVTCAACYPTPQATKPVDELELDCTGLTYEQVQRILTWHNKAVASAVKEAVIDDYKSIMSLSIDKHIRYLKRKLATLNGVTK